MKKFILLLFIASVSCLIAQDPPLIDSRDHTVMISAEASLDPVQIKLSWSENPLAVAYGIRKKAVDAATFPQMYIAELTKDQLEYVDTDVEVGKAYEYEIRAISKGGLPAKDSEGTNVVAEIDFIAFGYAVAGAGIPEPDDYGVMLLLVDETITEELAMEINRLEEDLTLEGWSVIRHEVPRAESFDKDKVAIVKNLIKDEYAQYGAELKTVFLLGRVPVPYSGNLAPDGHGNHIGAWPADMYYGEMQDSYWTDKYINNDTTASRDENKNLENDGKFDVSMLPENANIDLMVGRVDLYNMPAFAESEIELLRNYLEQNHKFRTNDISYQRRGLIKDAGFPASKLLEGFAASGWRNFGAFFGGDNVSKQDFLNALKDESYMWSYGTGPGSYTSAGQIGTTQDYVDNEVKGLFTMLFGSYFGDWDSKNNLLRAPLCNKYPALSSAWAARPQWFMHHMAAGYSLGYSARFSQNNFVNRYLSNYQILPPDYPNGVIYSTGARQVHTALLGDPTLRLYGDNEAVPMPRNLSAMVIHNGAELTWDPPAEDGEYYYDIYRRIESDNVFRKINDTRIEEETYTDNEGFEGKVEYLVKTVTLFNTNTALIYKGSRSLYADLLNTDVEENPLFDNTATVYPNPAKESTRINLNLGAAGNISASIYDAFGNLVHDFGGFTVQAGQHSLGWDLSNTDNVKVPSGAYVLRVNTPNEVITSKIIITR